MKRTGRLYWCSLRCCWAAMLIAAFVVLPGSAQRATGEILFGPPRLLFENGACPSVSRDGLTLYFAADRPGGHGSIDLWVATRASAEDDWDTPVNLGPTVNTSGWEAMPGISADGRTLFFGDANATGVPPLPGGVGSSDIWMTTRATTEDDWSAPVNLGAPVNSPTAEGHASMSPDGLTCYFARWDEVTEMDVWMASRATVDDDWDAPVSLGSTVNSNRWDQPGNVSTDGLTLVLASEREGGIGGADLWLTTRSTVDDDWAAPVNLGPTINTETHEATPWVSADFPAVGSTLYYFAFSGEWRVYAPERDSIYAAQVVGPIPEPSTMTLLLGGGLCLLIHVRRLRRKRG